jgi:glutamate synthase (NADPH) small chain
MVTPSDRLPHQEGRYARVQIPEEDRETRQETFALIERAYSPDEAILEGQRCLQCAMPFCVQACPITQDCRGYIIACSEGRFDEAARLTLQDNPFATVLCKCCYHYCEEDCVMGGKGTPIAIRHLKRAALDFGKSDLLYVPSAPKHERVAIVGGGPAGLMAAWELCLRGYGVTLYESENFLGGQIDTIPRYHLEDTDFDTDLSRFRNLDLTFVLGKKAGKDFTPQSLLAEGYQAVYLAMGASAPRALGIPGEELPGVFSALPFLLQKNMSPDPPLGRVGRKVVVLGGGDVALDAARSSLRVAKKGDVTVIYRRDRKEMPAGLEEVDGGEYEGIKYMFQRAPVRILGRNHVEGIVVQRVALGPPDQKGRRRPEPVPGSDETVPCDTVVVAIGQQADLEGLSPDLKMKLTSQGWPEGGNEDWMTGVEGVFASGGKSVVYAMAAGTRSARAIDAYIAKKKGRAPSPRPDPFGGPVPPPVHPSGYGEPTWVLE